MAAAVAQDYPRISEGEEFAGLLDEKKLTPHTYRISQSKLRQIIADAVKSANRKASRAILNIPEKSTDAEMRKIFLKEGRKLLDYFRQYCGDPPATAYQCLNRHYSEVAIEQFRNRTLQKERMNSGWRYQFIAYKCALAMRKRKLAAEIRAVDPNIDNWNFMNHLQRSTGLSSNELMQLVCDILSRDRDQSKSPSKEATDAIFKEFGEQCKKQGLLDQRGRFHDSRKLLHFFCTA